MSNYKCIRHYPGGPDVGYISKPHKVQPETDKNCHYYMHNWFNPEEFPEYWESVVDKDYEILKVVAKWSSPSYSPGDFIDYNKMIDYDTIYSVKRLSDGEIFTIGDMIGYPSIPNTKIESFTIRDNKIAAWGKFISSMNGFVLLNGVSKSKKPLFITEDGIDKFEGNMCFFVTPTQYSLGFGSIILGSEFKFALVRFHDQKKAEAWIEENKPQYSKLDMIAFCNYAKSYVSGHTTVPKHFDHWIEKIKK